jgi:cobalt-zinc-cadmium efflux system outer membrane protein
MNAHPIQNALLLLGLIACASQAQTLQDWLPSTEQVAPVLQASPQIQAARARQQAQLQRARGLEAGAGEWALRLSQQQRRVRDPQERFAETTLALERPLRLWGKAGMDAAIASQDREVARITLADALHEASRQLLNQWFDLLRAQLEVDSAQRERQLAGELQRQAQVRLRQGDISVLDARLTEAELQRSEAALGLAQAEQARSRAQLQRQYPGLPEPRWPGDGAAELPAPAQDLAAALGDFLQRHHELNLLRAESRRQQQLAERIERDRWPDPTVGLYTARERAGGEQLVGVSVAVPLSGIYRESQARAAQAEAQMLQERMQQLERQLTADFEARWQRLALQRQAMSALRAAAATQRQAAEKSLTAYTLGEHSMTELIQNRRLANEQQLASQRLQIDGLHHRALFELDAHRLWDLDD